MFGSRKPEKSRRGRFWEWLNPALGKELRAWIVGPVVGVETHYLGRTQPCRRYITGGRMRCYCTTSKLGSEWKGYVPLVDENGVQCFSVIGERYAELAYSIPLFAPVTVARLKRAGSPVCVKQSTWTDQPPPSRNGELRSQDIRPWLLKLWGDKSLVEFLEAHPECREAQPADSIPTEDFSPMLRAAAKRANGQDHGQGVKREPAEIAEVIKKLPALNGKGRH